MTNSKKKVMIIVSMLCLLCGLFIAGINTVRAENNNLANLFSDNENSGSALQAEASYKVRLVLEEGIDYVTIMYEDPSKNTTYFESVGILLNSSNMNLAITYCRRIFVRKSNSNINKFIDSNKSCRNYMPYIQYRRGSDNYF